MGIQCIKDIWRRLFRESNDGMNYEEVSGPAPILAIRVLPSLATITRCGLSCTLATGGGRLAVFFKIGTRRAASRNVEMTFV